jgi:hypothetical protein
MLVLKENITGFIYDSVYGRVTKIYNEPLSEEKIEMINETLDEDDILFSDIESINEMFTIDSKENLESDSEGLNEVLNFI